MTADDELAELLELADGELELPGDMEQQLLDAVLETARGGSAPADPQQEPLLETSGAARSDVVVVFDGGAGPPSPVGRRRLVPLLAAAAALVVIIGSALVFTSSDRTDQIDTIDSPDPTSTTIEAPSPIGDAELCQQLRVLLVESGLVGPQGRPPADRFGRLESTAEVLRQVATRPDLTSTVAPDVWELNAAFVAAIGIERVRGSSESTSNAIAAARASIDDLLRLLPSDHCLLAES